MQLLAKLFIFTLLTLTIYSDDLPIKAASPPAAYSTKPANQEPFVRVTKIVDGDTFWVDNGTAKGLKVRLIGIDAPESQKVYNKPKGYYGPEAKMYLTRLLTNKKVKLLGDVDPIDRYGRTLSYAYLEDGTFVNAELVKRGYAVLLTIPPNVKFSAYFVKLQNEARRHNRGLWRKL